MARRADSGLNKHRLRVLLGLFFIALAIPSAALTWQAYSRLQWESFHQYQLLAEELLGRVDRRISDLVVKEEARAFTDYRFLVIEGLPAANYVQRSPLSRFPVNSDIPGLLGYFQVDAEGRFTTPLLPDDPEISTRAYGIADAELGERRALRERLLQILSQGGVTTSAESHALSYHDESQTAEEDAVAERGARPATVAPPVASQVPAMRDDAGVPTAPVVGRSAAAGSVLSKRQTAIEVQEQQLAQAAFERLSEESTAQRKGKQQQGSIGNIGRVDELKLDQAFDSDRATTQMRRPLSPRKERIEYGVTRREQNRAPTVMTPAQPTGDAEQEPGETALSPQLVRIFESEVDPFEFGRIGSEHFVLYRKVWRAGRRHIQGAVIESAALLRELIEIPYRDTALSGMSRLGIVFDGEILSAFGGQHAGRYLSSYEELSGTLLYRGRLSTPLDKLGLIISVTSMPSGKAGELVIWVALTLGLVLSGGLVLMYRLGVKQIELSRQQQDFVSAVSHELKTPLTSIRMYSEMLREGWADEGKKRTYYDFIHDESERLSRLITNVLQLARMSRDELKVEARPVAVAQLMNMVQSKVSTQIRHAGFELKLHCDAPTALRTVEVDPDAFVQILINLVDNALKFAARADEQLIEIGCRDLNDGRVEFAVRDHGPGIPREQMKKIFMLFYRSENELTRKTVGTGIGLALVHRLATAMDGDVDVVNRDPGAEFHVRFPAAHD